MWFVLFGGLERMFVPQKQMVTSFAAEGQEIKVEKTQWLPAPTLQPLLLKHLWALEVTSRKMNLLSPTRVAAVVPPYNDELMLLPMQRQACVDLSKERKD